MLAIGKTAIQQNGERRAAQPVTISRPSWNFVRHLLEMVVAMVAGMMLLGGVVSLFELTLGQPEAST